MEAAVPPAADTRSKLAIGVVCLILAAMAGLFIKAWNWGLAVVPALAIMGLVRRVRWGRRSAAVLLWLLLLVGVGLMLPQGEGDQLTGSKPRPLEDALSEAFACIAAALLGLHLLGRYKNVFRPDWL